MVKKSEKKIDYDVVNEFSGHQSNKGVSLKEAAKDIYSRVKNKAMQCSIKGEFIEFNTEQELESQLDKALENGFSVRVFDELIGG